MARRAAQLGAIVLVVVIGLAAASVSDTAARTTAGFATTARVARVIDGDTIDLADGTRVRLVQIDTPELGTGECYSRAAGRELRALLPGGRRGRPRGRSASRPVHRYGAYCATSSQRRNLNVELVHRGAATVRFYDGDRGATPVPLSPRKPPPERAPRLERLPEGGGAVRDGGHRPVADGRVDGGRSPRRRRADPSYPTSASRRRRPT